MRVAVIGGGAAGCAAASLLAKHFRGQRTAAAEAAATTAVASSQVVLLEKGSQLGGQATSIDIDKERFGASYLNDGVQGGSPAFKHTYRQFHAMGLEEKPVDLKIGFGHGPDGFWTNLFETPVTLDLRNDIKKFGSLLSAMNYVELVLAILPIRLTLKIFRFSKQFGANMVYPLMALFLGTGNQTQYVPTAVLCRLFTDPLMKLWDYDSDRLLASVPRMYAFPELREFYIRWQSDMEKDKVDVHTSTTVNALRYQKDGTIEIDYTQDDHLTTIIADKVIFACEPSAIMAIVGDQASRAQKFILGKAPYFNDVSVTHNDVDYMRKYYHIDADEHLPVAEGQTRPESFDPMYFIHPYGDEAPSKVEMSFDCTRYQPQFDADNIDIKDHVFQTIFLNDSEKHLWTKDEIRKDKIIFEKWWWQLGHKWSHYLRTVPLLASINGKCNTYYTGSWTLVNMHEIAILSGMAAAIQLGATYPEDLAQDESASKLMKIYMMLAHWRWQ